MNLKKKTFSFLKDELILHTAIVFFGAGLGSFLNLLYHLISVRLLTPQDYGVFNVLISFIMVTSIAISPLGATLTRFFSEYIAKGDLAILKGVFKKLVKRLFFTACASFLIFMFFSSALAKFLKTEAIYIIFSGGIIALSFFPPLAVSLFQSFQKFMAYSVIGIIASFGKVLVGAGLMLAGLKVIGGLSGFLVSDLLIILIALFFIPSVLKKKMDKMEIVSKPSINLLPIYKYFFPVFLAMFSFTFLTNVDVILVKHFFSPLDAGYYSIAQMVGKIVLFLPSALVIVIFPKSTTHYVRGSNPNKLLYKSLVLATLLCGAITVFCFLFPEFILKILTSKQNPISNSLVGVFALAMSFYALVWIILNFMIATHNLRIVPFLLAAVTLEAISIYAWHSTLKMVLYWILIFSAISFIVSLCVVRISPKKQA